MKFLFWLGGSKENGQIWLILLIHVKPRPGLPMSLDTTPLKFYFYYQEVLLVEYHKKSITMTTLESLQVRNLVWWELLLTLFAAGMSQHHRGERHYRVPGRGLLRCLQHPSGLSSTHRRLLRSEVGEMNDATTCLTLTTLWIFYISLCRCLLLPWLLFTMLQIILLGCPTVISFSLLGTYLLLQVFSW